MNGDAVYGLTKYQYLPRLNNEVDFEDFIECFFNELESTNSYKRFGRKGQKQHGLDIFSLQNKTVIQCKLKDIRRDDKKIKKELLDDFHKDISAFKAFNKDNGKKYNRFIYTSTWFEDKDIEVKCMNESTDSLIVEYWSWDSLLRKAENKISPEIVKNVLFRGLDSRLNNQEKYLTGTIGKIDYREYADKPILQGIYLLLSYLFKGVEYIPLHILMRNWPFTDASGSGAYYDVFGAYIDSPQLMEFFSSINIDDNGDVKISEKFSENVKNANDKAKWIVEKLSNNLIFQVISQTGSEYKIIRQYSHSSCDCIRCRYLRFNYVGVLELLDSSVESAEDKLTHAFYNYRMGRYVQAARIYNEIRDSLETAQNFICNYNLRSLGNILRLRFYGENAQAELVEQSRDIDMNHLFCNTSDEPTGIVKYLHKNEFILNAERRINKCLNKLKQHYELQQNGGWSSRNEGWALVNEYLQIHTFISSNQLTYEQFPEFQDLTNRFIEGVILSYLIDQTDNGRVEKIDDFLVFVVINHANSVEIRKLITKFKVKSIPYENSNTEKLSVFGVFDQFIDQGLSIKIDDSIESRHFREIFNEHFSNLLTLLGVIEIDKKLVNNMKLILIAFLKKESILYPRTSDSLLLFFFSHPDEQHQDWIINLLFTMLEEKTLFRYDSLERVATHLSSSYSTLAISDQQTTQLINKLDHILQQDSDGFRMNILIKLAAGIKSPKLSKYTRERVLERLAKSFNDDIYYEATIFEVIPFSLEFYDKYKNFSKPTKQRLDSLRTFFGVKNSNRHPFLNQFINLSYKVEVDLSVQEEFKGIDPYYDWLLDLDGFDYSKFDPKWICEYPTKFYYDEFRKYKMIRKALETYLSNNKDEKISQTYFDIFIRDSSDE